MTSKFTIVIGPVLSYRGSDGQAWKVSALVGFKDREEAPAFHVGGQPCPAPTLLLRHGGHRYYRYDLTCPIEERERRVTYGIAEAELSWQFTVPGLGYAPRMAYVSCNGFSDPAVIRNLSRPADAVWQDLLASHDRALRHSGYLLDKEQLWHESRIHDKKLQRFHLLLMGGDQIYFDAIWEELAELNRWVRLSRQDQLKYPVSDDLRKQIDDYYLSRYAERWLPASRGPWNSRKTGDDAADAMARIPTVMMWDDHDIFDGWGSFTCEMQHCEVFQAMFASARKAFWIFQLQHHPKALPELKSVSRRNLSSRDPQFQEIQWTNELKGDKLALPLLENQPGFTYGLNIGPLSILVADLRTERSRTQILGSSSWQAIKTWLGTHAPDEAVAHPGTRCQHLLVMSSVPVVHPKLSAAEGFFDLFDRWTDDKITDGNSDDLRDHWSHDDHEGERKRLIETLFDASDARKMRVSLLSGDVHVAAWGTIYRKDGTPTNAHAPAYQLTSSAIVHPSLSKPVERVFLGILNMAAAKPQVLDVQHQVEMLVFPGYNRYVMPSRNWLAVELDLAKEPGAGSKLWATWRCETASNHFSNHLQAIAPHPGIPRQ